MYTVHHYLYSCYYVLRITCCWSHIAAHAHTRYVAMYHRPCYAVMLEITCTYPTFSIFKLFSNRLRESAAAAHVNFPFKFQKNWFFWKNRWNRLSLSRFSEHGQLHQKIEFFVFCRWTSKFEWELCRSHLRWSPNLHWHRRFNFFTVGGQSDVTQSSFLMKNRQFFIKKALVLIEKWKKKHRSFTDVIF